MNVLFVGSNPKKDHHIEPARGNRLFLLKLHPKKQDYENFDEVHEVDVFDRDQVISRLKDKKIEACITRFEPQVPILGMICDHFKIPGPSMQSCFNARDKLLMRDCFDKAGIPQPKYHKIESMEDMKDAAKKIGYPFILKPLSGAKSRYIKKINSEKDLKPSFDLVKNGCSQNTGTLFRNYQNFPGYSRDYSKTMIAEEVLTGKQVTTTSLIFNREVHHIALADLVTAQDKGLDAFYLISRTTPSVLSEEMQEKIKKISAEAIVSLGLDNTFLHPELILTEHGPKVIEVAARVGGYRTEMTELAFGIDMNKAVYELATGKMPDITKKHNKGSTATEIWPTTSGVIKGYNNIELLMKNSQDFVLKRGIGEKFYTPPIGEKHAAHFFTVDEGPNRSLKKADEILDNFNFII